MIVLPTTLRVTRAAAAAVAVAVRVPAGRSVGLAAASSSSSSFRPIGRRSWASTLVVMDDIEAQTPDGSSSTTSYATPETTRRVVSAAMQLRVSQTGIDSEIHLLVIDPVPVPSRIPIGVTKVLHWKTPDAGAANAAGGNAAAAAEAEAKSAATGRAFVSDVAAQAMEHAFVGRADATHLLATFGRSSGAALAQVATNLNVKLHENVVEIKGRGTPRGGCRKSSLEGSAIDRDFSPIPSPEKDAFVEADKGLVTDQATRRILTVSSSHFPPVDLRDAGGVPVEVLTPPSRASQLLWKVLPAGVAVAVLICAI